MNDSSSIERVLALVPNWLGDAVMCTPALRALRRRFPSARLAVAGRESVCRLLSGLPWLDQLCPLPDNPRVLALFGLGWKLRPHARDLCVIFPHSLHAALLARFTYARRRLAYDRDQRGWLLTHKVTPYRINGRIIPIYMAREYLDLLEPLGCRDDGAGLELHVPDAEFAGMAPLRRGQGPLVGIAPGAAFGPSKRWPPERFARVADALVERAGARCVLLTGPGEEEIRRKTIASARTSFLESQRPPTIESLKAAIASVELLVCNDSGPRHIAIAFQKPNICIMGSTSPRYTDSPWEHGKIVRVAVDCGPCQKPVCATDHRCMNGIDAGAVIGAAMSFLD